MASIPSLDFSAGLQGASSVPYGGSPTGSFLAGAQGFMTGMEQVRKRKEQELKAEREKRQFQQQEMLNQMRIKELDLRMDQFRAEMADKNLKREWEKEDRDYTTLVRDQQQSDRERRLAQEGEDVAFQKLQRERTIEGWEKSDQEKEDAEASELIIAQARKDISGLDPSDVEGIQAYIDSTYNALIEIGGKQANNWLSEVGSGSEESARMLKVQSDQATAAMKSEMETLSRVTTKLLENGNNFLSLSDEERAVIGNEPLQKEKVQTLLLKAQFALKNYNAGDVVKHITSYQNKWIESRAGLSDKVSPEDRIEAAKYSDSMLDDLTELYQMYSAVPIIAAAIQQIPDDWSSRVVDDAYLTAYDYYDGIAKKSKDSDQRKNAAETAARYSQQYTEITGETIDQGRQRMQAESSIKSAARSSMRPSPAAAPQGLSSAGIEPKKTQRGSSGRSRASFERKKNASQPKQDQGELLSFNSVGEAAQYFESPEGQQYAGRSLDIMVAGRKLQNYKVSPN